MDDSAQPSKSWEYPKKSGIRIRSIDNAHAGAAYGMSYLVIVPAKLTGSLRLRRQFKERRDAEEWADDTLIGIRKQGQAFFALSDQERQEATSTAETLRRHGLTLPEAVAFAVKHLRPNGRDKTVRETVAELVASKEQRYERGDLREQSIRDFRFRSGRFATAFQGRRLVDVTASEIKAWLIGQRLSCRSNKNYLATVGEVFKYGVQRRYIADTPLSELTDSDRKEICGSAEQHREPSILTAAEAERILMAALTNPDLGLLGAVILALFCGVRTEELKRLDWESVRLSEDRKSRYRGVERTHAQGQYVVAACNLVRMAKLMVTSPPKPARA